MVDHSPLLAVTCQTASCLTAAWAESVDASWALAVAFNIADPSKISHVLIHILFMHPIHLKGIFGEGPLPIDSSSEPQNCVHHSVLKPQFDAPTHNLSFHLHYVRRKFPGSSMPTSFLLP